MESTLTLAERDGIKDWLLRARRAHRQCAGMTLTEVMVAGAIGVMMMGAIMTTYIFCLRSFRDASNYSEFRRTGRRAVDWFARDMRSVSQIISYGGTSITVSIPTVFNGTGGVISNKTVSYIVSNGSMSRTDSSTGQTITLARNVQSGGFSLFDRSGLTTASLDVTKGVQLDLRLNHAIRDGTRTERFLSATINLRNKP